MLIALVFKLDTQEVINFYATQGAVKIPGVPELDPTRLVDGDRTIQLVKPLPVTSEGRTFEFRSKVLGVYDKGKAGTVVRSEDALVDTVSGDVYARNIGSLFYVGQGNWGGPRGPASQKFPPPEGRRADVVFELKIDEQAAHLYRWVSHFEVSSMLLLTPICTDLTAIIIPCTPRPSMENRWATAGLSCTAFLRTTRLPMRLSESSGEAARRACVTCLPGLRVRSNRAIVSG